MLHVLELSGRASPSRNTPEATFHAELAIRLETGNSVKLTKGLIRTKFSGVDPLTEYPKFVSAVREALVEERLFGDSGNVVQRWMDSLLWEFASDGRTTSVHALLECGASPRAIHSSSPLVVAAGKGHTGTVELLLNYGCGVNDLEGAALTNAVLSGQLEMVRWLVARGADLNANKGEALRWARSRTPTIYRLLIEAGATPTTKGKFPVWLRAGSSKR